MCSTRWNSSPSSPPSCAPWTRASLTPERWGLRFDHKRRPSMTPATEDRKSHIKKRLLFLATLPLPLLLLFLRPLGMTFQQSGVLAALVLAILWWVTGAVERTVASLLLLAVFLLVSGAPARTVFTFPLSENFLMIVFSFLFSQGIAGSGLVAKLVEPPLMRFAKTPARLLLFMLLSAAVMIFIIPQPFSRIILLSLIFQNYFDRVKLDAPLRAALLFALYFFSILINMTTLRGDIILNGALLSMGGVSLDEGGWMAYMAVPTLAYLLLAVLLYCFVFRKLLSAYRPAPPPEKAPLSLTGKEKRNLVFLIAVVLVWATESFHGVSGTLVVMAATALMFPLGLLKLPDLKSVNVKLLIFLTAAFAIGGTLKACGVADKLFALLLPLFPDSFGLGYALVVLAVSILLHTLLGSNITTMSVVVPGLMTIGAGVAPKGALLFLIYIAVCGQFLLPFHHVILLLGEGKGCYSVKELLRMGLPHTVLTAFCALFLYLPWWRLLGLA
ncbi:MAG: hypothetical protein EOM52_07745 [Clostridia bacterium]|nr:hypothetical protein [Clostridia bacterium]